MPKTLISGLFVLISLSSFAQNTQSVSPRHFQERVYLHTDKAYYYQGESIWFSLFMSYGSPAMSDTLSHVVYVDLINPSLKVMQTSIVKLDSARGSGVIKLLDELPPGNYILRAYTNWMRNYGLRQLFYKAIPVLEVNYTVKEMQPMMPATDSRLVIATDKSVYKQREKVKLRIQLHESPSGNLPSGTFSISITDEALVVPVGGGHNIMRNFPLPSDLPSDMLTKFRYPVESGIWLRGIVTNKKDRQRKLTVVQEGLTSIYQVSPNDTGVFVVKDLIIYDTVKFLVNGGRGKNELLPHDVPKLPNMILNHGLVRVSTASVQRNPYGTHIKTQILKEVEVKATRPQRQYENPYGKPDYYIKSESMQGYSSLALAIAAKVPQFTLLSSSGHYYLAWTRSMTGLRTVEPMVFIDNAQVMTGSGQTMGDRLDIMVPFMIDHIEVSTMINSGLGANGSGGVIYVFSKRGDDAFEKAPLLKLRGFDKPVAFESPDYLNPATDTTLADLRATVYWNPRVSITPQKQCAEVSFFTSDRSGKYRVIVEGVENKKTPLHAEALITVE